MPIRRALGVLALAILLWASPLLASAALRWRTFEDPKGRFLVSMPGDPTRREDRTETLLGAVRNTTYTLALGDEEFAVEAHDFPRVATLLLSETAILDRVARGVVDDVDGRPVGEGQSFLAGRSARVLHYEVPDDPIALEEARFVMEGARIYVLTARRPKKRPEDVSSDRFFTSFALLERSP